MEILKAVKMRKSFPGIVAVDGVDFEVYENEIVSLVGENGAGKSTLIKMLTGVLKPDEGKIYVNGKEVSFRNPIDAFKHGISVIHQELNLAPNLTVYENVFLASEITKSGKKSIFSRSYDEDMYKRTQEILNMLGANFPPDIYVKDLSTAQMQLVEISKALVKNPRIIFMDEPTSSLTVNEVKILFKIIRRLKEEHGISIVFVSHRLEEVLEISDRIVVMRDGKRVASLSKEKKEFNIDIIIKHMVGRDIEFFPHGIETKAGEVILKVENLKWKDKVKNVSFELRKGEVLGFAGLVGSGRTETMYLIFGAEKKERGRIIYKGKEVEINNPKEAIAMGIGLIPEDRKLQGLILKFTVKDNITLPSLDKLKKGFVVDEEKSDKLAEDFVKKLDIKTPSIYKSTETLSGGNQQKVVLAKWLALNSDVLIFDEPTRGIDVATKAEIHRMIRELASQGKAVIMISSELPEILHLSDRIAVMWEGRIVSVLDNKQRKVSQQEVMYYASGQKVIEGSGDNS